MTGHALSLGQSDISLTATITYPEKYVGNNNVFNSRSVVVVEPGLQAETPSHRCHSL